jgi:hypothetical protein
MRGNEITPPKQRDRWSRSLIGQLCLRKLFRIGDGKNTAAAPDRLLPQPPNLCFAPGSDNALIAKEFSPRGTGNPAAGGDADRCRGDGRQGAGENAQRGGDAASWASRSVSGHALIFFNVLHDCDSRRKS